MCLAWANYERPLRLLRAKYRNYQARARSRGLGQCGGPDDGLVVIRRDASFPVRVPPPPLVSLK